MSVPVPTRHSPAAKLPPVLFYAPDNRHMAQLIDSLTGQVDLQWQNSKLDSVPAVMSGAPQRWQVVLLDFSAPNSDYSADLARQIAVHAPQLPLIAVGTPARDGAGSVLAAMRAGVREFIDIEAAPAEIAAALRRGLSAASASRLTPVPTPANAPPAQKGRGIALLGVRAGVGCSTLAVHLAALCAASGDSPRNGRQTDTGGPSSQRNRALVIDLGFPIADSALYLGQRCDFDLDNAVAAADRFDATLAGSTLAHHASGAAVLSRNPRRLGLLPEGERLGPLLDRLGHIFPTTFYDLGGLHPTQLPEAALREAHDIWLVTDQSVSALMALDECLAQLGRLGLRDARLHLVVNRYLEAGGVAPAQIASRFDLPLLATLPERTDTLRASANQGELLHERHPRDPYLRALRQLQPRLPALSSAVLPAETAAAKLVNQFMRKFPWTST